MEPNPEPKANTLPPVWPLVLDDMRGRHELGIKRYGTPLQPFNGRKPLVDAYEEVLDLAVYLRQEIEERKRERMSVRIDEMHRKLREHQESVGEAMALMKDSDTILKSPTSSFASGPRTEGHCDKIRAGDAGGMQESAFQRCRRLEAELEHAHRNFKIEQDLHTHQEKEWREQRERWASRVKEAFDQRDGALAKIASLEQTLSFYLKADK